MPTEAEIKGAVDRGSLELVATTIIPRNLEEMTVPAVVIDSSRCFRRSDGKFRSTNDSSYFACYSEKTSSVIF